MRPGHWNQLFRKLYDTEYKAILYNDQNRIVDGLDLRIDFEREDPYKRRIPQDKPCSVFEMLIALCIRVDRDVAYNRDYGNRVTFWFFDMLDAMGIGNQDHLRYDDDTVTIALNRFMSRTFDSDGKGSIAIVQNPPHDMRTIDLWYQIMWHVSEVTKGE